MCRTENASIVHLEMWIDTIRQQIKAIEEHGNDLEKGYPVFQLVRQKLSLELDLAQLKKDK
ncbi:MAG: hypothetical protein DRQ78_12360 [Epsilonproteobacteria bacterium]|nr:MAG: hypothetical protein DRQ78_12360 [Campylobacterota bacterium]